MALTLPPPPPATYRDWRPQVLCLSRKKHLHTEILSSPGDRWLLEGTKRSDTRSNSYFYSLGTKCMKSKLSKEIVAQMTE